MATKEDVLRKMGELGLKLLELKDGLSLSEEGKDKLQAALAFNKLKEGKDISTMNLTPRQSEILKKELTEEKQRQKNFEEWLKNPPKSLGVLCH